jgi:predicted glycosyltransferase
MMTPPQPQTSAEVSADTSPRHAPDFPSGDFRLWIDLDNSPHVPLFAPLIRLLRQQGAQVMITARRFAQTVDLVEQLGVDATIIGQHAGRSKVKKVLNLPVRTLQLRNAVRQFAPHLALSHGSRTQVLAARLMRVPSVVMFDYEWTEMQIFSRLATHLLCPSIIDDQRLQAAGVPLGNVSRYHGLKEHLYLPQFSPDPAFRHSLDVAPDQLLVTIRPPGLIGNYHDPRSEAICREVIRTAAANRNAVVVVLPKTRLEAALVRAALPSQAAARVVIPERALPGLQLLYHSDLAISGGGTMNRESALLGTPTWSMFTGKRGAVDEYLSAHGTLRFLESEADVGQIQWTQRPAGRNDWKHHSEETLHEVGRVIRMFAPFPEGTSHKK